MLNPRTTQGPCVRSRLSAPVWRAARLLGVAAAAGCLLACSPALDWRQAGPKEVDILLDFPCKPLTVTQPVMLAGKRVAMSMTGCKAADMTFALAHADLGDAALVAPALAELHHSALANVSARVLDSRPARVKHAASGLADALELDLAGREPGGQPLREHVLLFAQGTQVFQATVLGQPAHYKPDAAHMFASSVSLGAAPN